jgi:hypothetical protein
MKQQLFLADKIHFMTQPDKDDFLSTMKCLNEKPVLYPIKEALENYQNVNMQLEELFLKKEEVKKQKQLFTSKSSSIRKKLAQEKNQLELQLATHEKALLLLPSDNEKIDLEISQLELKKSQESNIEKSQELAELTENTKSKSSEEEDEFMFSFPEDTQEKEKVDIDSEILKLKRRKEQNIEKIEHSKIAIIKFSELLGEYEIKALQFKKEYDNGLILWERKESAIDDKMQLLKLDQFYLFKELPKELFEDLESKCCCIPGIYTVNPLSLHELLPTSEYHESKALQILAERQCNILQFGMIRGEKGVDEAIDLALKMKELGLTNKVIIAGKLMLDIGMVKNIFCRIFDIDSEEFYKHLNDALQNSKITEEILKPKEIRNPTIIQNLITSEKVHEKFNDFCMKLYKQLAEEKHDCVSNIDIHFNVTEENLRKLAIQCKYAIKLDHKGLAHNASTIVSCFGFYLPVFTTCGLCTNNEFLSFELSNEKLNNPYSGVAIMPHPIFTSNNDFLEVRSVNPTTTQIIEFIKEEEKHPEKYMERLIALNKLYNDKIYNCDNVTKLLLKEVFIPLSQSKKLTHQFTNNF